MNKESESESQLSEGDIPYVGFDEFENEIAEKLPFGKKWSQQQKNYEWNRLVLDKA